MEGRIDEIAVKQSYTDDDFYLDCCLNYTFISLSKNETPLEEQTIVDVEGTGVLAQIRKAAYTSFRVYIDNKLLFTYNGGAQSGSRYWYFGTSALSGDASYYSYIITDLKGGDLLQTPTGHYYGVLPRFKKRLKITAWTSSSSSSAAGDLFTVGYGIGGAAV